MTGPRFVDVDLSKQVRFIFFIFFVFLSSCSFILFCSLCSPCPSLPLTRLPSSLSRRFMTESLSVMEVGFSFFSFSILISSHLSLSSPFPVGHAGLGHPRVYINLVSLETFASKRKSWILNHFVGLSFRYFRMIPRPLRTVDIVDRSLSRLMTTTTTREKLLIFF